MYNVMVDRARGKPSTWSLHSAPSYRKTSDGQRIPQIPVPELDPHLNQNTTLKPSSKVTATSCRAALKLSLSIRLKQSSIRCSYTGIRCRQNHLANAIGTKIKELYPEKLLYVSAHLFQVQYTDSVRNNTTNDFINFYQTIDILIDDIQNLPA